MTLDVTHLTLHETAASLGLRPDADPELVFWRTKALERSLEIAQLRRQIVCLKDAIAVYEEES